MSTKFKITHTQLPLLQQQHIHIFIFVMAMKYKCIFLFLHLLSLQIIYALAVSLVKVQPQDQRQQLLPLLLPPDSPASTISRGDFSSSNSLTIQPRQSLESLSPKRFFDFITDPSLLITILHSLEVAYWTFPFGFLLKPIINFFRVPNRRSLDSRSINIPTAFSPFAPGQIDRPQLAPQQQPASGENIRSVRSVNNKVNLYHLKLLSSLAKFDSLNNNNINKNSNVKSNNHQIM